MNDIIELIRISHYQEDQSSHNMPSIKFLEVMHRTAYNCLKNVTPLVDPAIISNPLQCLANPRI